MKVLSGIATLLLLTFSSFAQSVLPADNSFGNQGVTNINFDDTTLLEHGLNTFVRDKRYNTYAFGTFAYEKSTTYEHNPYGISFVCKLDSTGKLDSSFYENGYRILTSPGLLGAGSLYPGFVRMNNAETGIYLFRFDGDINLYSMKLKTDGTNDEAYGRKGNKNIDFTGITNGRRLALRDVIPCIDGGFILIANTYQNAVPSTIYTFKLDADGNIDPAYGTNGFSNFDFAQRISFGTCAQLSENHFVMSVIQDSKVQTGIDSLRLLKLSLAGVIDSGFNHNASRSIDVFTHITEYPFDHLLTRLTILPDSSFVFYASNRTGAILQYKFTKTGTPDTTFDNPKSGIPKTNKLDLLPAADARVNQLWLAEIGYNDYVTRLIKINVDSTGNLDIDGRMYIPTLPLLTGMGGMFTWLTNIEKEDMIFAVSGSSRGICSYKVTGEGQLDPAYHSKGFNEAPMYNSVDLITSAAPLSNGGILGTTYSINREAVASVKDRFHIFRLTKDGKKDATFGNRGTVKIRDSMTISDYRVDRKGRMIIFGQGVEPYSDWNSSLMIDRYTAEGKPDPSFGLNGRVIFEPFQRDIVPALPGWFTIFGLQADNSMLALGMYRKGSAKTTKISVLKLLENGKLDSSFGGDGIVQIDLRADFSETYANDGKPEYILALKDQSILVVIQEQDSYYYKMFRLNQYGQIIRSGGKNGKVDLEGSFHGQRFKMMVQDHAGDIIYMTSNPLEWNTSIVLTRLNPFDLSSSRHLAYLDYSTTGFRHIEPGAIVPLYNGDFFITGTAAYTSDIYEPPVQFVVRVKKTGGLDSSFAVNGVMTITPPIPGISQPVPDDLSKATYILNGFEANTAFKDVDGNLVVAASAINNRLKDIWMARYLVSDKPDLSAPEQPVIWVNPSDTICSGSTVYLSIDTTGCDQCAYAWSDGQTTSTIEVNKAGLYTVSVYNSADVEMVSRNIYNATFQYPALSISYTGCPEPGLRFTATTDNAALQDAVNWFIDDTLSAHGKTFSFEAANDMKIHATLDVERKGCAADTVISSNVITVNCIRYPEPSEETGPESLKIYPNPTSGKIYFSITTSVAGNYNVELWNAAGRIFNRSVMWINQGESEHMISLSAVPPGIYYLKIYLGEHRFLQKVYIQ